MPDQHFYLFVVIACVIAGVIVAYWPKNGSGNVNQNIAAVQRQAQTNRNRFVANHETKNSEATTKLNDANTLKAASIYNLAAVKDRLERGEQIEIATSLNSLTMLEKATQQGIGSSTYEALKLAEGTAQIKILEAQGLSDIEWARIEREHRLQIEGAMLLLIKEHGANNGLRAMFKELVREKDKIEKGDDSPEVKRRLVERYDKDIEFLDGVMDAREHRLLQENNREDS